MRTRLATPKDAATIARIYNQGIEDRTATFETETRTAEDVLAWFDGLHPVVVTEDDDGTVIAFARSAEYSSRACYRGIFEFAIYTDREQRRRGAGTAALRELLNIARGAGCWKLLSRVFVDNEASRAMVASLGFREVGVHHRHAKLDGVWRDVVVVEKFLAPIALERTSVVPAAPGLAPREQILRQLRSDAPPAGALTLEQAKALLEGKQAPDGELLDAAADSFFASKVHDATVRARFVELFRSYAALSPSAARDVYDALFSRLGRLSIALDLDGFYEALFVLKQIIGPTKDGARASDLGIHVPRLLDWMRQAVELPRLMRGRISPGNVTTLLMSLALAGAESEEQKQEVAELAAEAKERHRVEPPKAVRPSVPPPLPAAPSAAGPRLFDNVEPEEVSESELEVVPEPEPEPELLASEDIIESDPTPPPPAPPPLPVEAAPPPPPPAPVVEAKPKKKRAAAKSGSRPKRSRKKAEKKVETT